jgi:hypothetical protein
VINAAASTPSVFADPGRELRAFLLRHVPSRDVVAPSETTRRSPHPAGQ